MSGDSTSLIDAVLNDKTEEAFIEPDKSEQVTKLLSAVNNNDIDGIINVLNAAPPQETGGVIAISGFFFQFLTAIEYMIEVIEGKWDYLVLEYHQDIIVCKSDKVRFIQAKTSKETVLSVTDCEVCDGWIQKLIQMAALFKDKKDVITEFELATNFFIKNNTNRPIYIVEDYIYNEKFNMQVAENDFIKRIANKSNDYNYIEQCGESLIELMGRFSITPKVDKDNDAYIDKICQRLGKLLNLYVAQQDLFWIIGEMCRGCYYPENESVLFMNKDKCLQIIDKVHKEAIRTAREKVKVFDSKEIVEQVLSQIYDETINDPKCCFCKELSDELVEYESELKKSIDMGLDIHILLNRYMERNDISYKIRNLSIHVKQKKLVELLKLGLLLRILYERNIQINSKFNGLLIKQTEDSRISLIDLKESDTFDDGLIAIKEFLNNLGDKEIIEFLLNPHLAILQGDFDNSDLGRNQVKLFHRKAEGMDKLIEVNEDLLELLQDMDHMSNIPMKVNVINGKWVTNKFYRLRFQYKTFKDYCDTLNEEWGGIVKNA